MYGQLSDRNEARIRGVRGRRNHFWSANERGGDISASEAGQGVGARGYNTIAGDSGSVASRQFRVDVHWIVVVGTTASLHVGVAAATNPTTK